MQLISFCSPWNSCKENCFFHIQLHVSCMRKKSIAVLMSDCSSGLRILASREDFYLWCYKKIFVCLEERKSKMGFAFTLAGYSLPWNTYFHYILHWFDLSMDQILLSLTTPKMNTNTPRFYISTVIWDFMGVPECKQSKHQKDTIHSNKNK